MQGSWCVWHGGACVAGGMHVGDWGGACMAEGHACLGGGVGGMHGWGHAWPGACVVGGACMVRGMHGGGACMAGETATAVGGTHPTGMHSCTCRILNTGRVVTCNPGNRQTESQIGMTDNITFQQSACRKETTVNIRRLSNWDAR